MKIFLYRRLQNLQIFYLAVTGEKLLQDHLIRILIQPIQSNFSSLLLQFHLLSIKLILSQISNRFTRMLLLIKLNDRLVVRLPRIPSKLQVHLILQEILCRLALHGCHLQIPIQIQAFVIVLLKTIVIFLREELNLCSLIGSPLLHRQQFNVLEGEKLIK